MSLHDEVLEIFHDAQKTGGIDGLPPTCCEYCGSAPCQCVEAVKNYYRKRTENIREEYYNAD